MTLKARIRAIDRFIKGCREDGIYDDLNACCVMAGWDSLAGALTPLKGAAPTNSGFLATDYDRAVGIAGDASSYIDSNYAYPIALRNDCHMATYISAGQTSGLLAGYGDSSASGSALGIQGARLFQTSDSSYTPPDTTTVAFRGVSRDNADSYVYRGAKSDNTANIASASIAHLDFAVFARQRNTLTPDNATDATLSFYSFGSATDLALLDARVSTLMADLRAIEETGFDRDAIAYIRAVEEADGAYLETDVKVAINNLVSGLKSDGLWDAMASSCLLCGPRTLAGALVPLRGDAGAPNGFVSGDYSRTDGLGDPDGTSYLVTGLPYNEVNANDEHLAVYVTSLPGNDQNLLGGGSIDPVAYSRIGYIGNQQKYDFQTGVGLSVAAQFSTGFVGGSRSSSATVTRRNAGSSVTAAAASTTRSTTSTPYGVFCGNYSTLTGAAPTIAKLAFYSIGSSVDLAKLDSHVTAYVTAIGAAV